MRGLDRVAATRLAFFLGIPALVGAGVLRAAVRARAAGSAAAVTIVGTVVSFVVAYASVAWLHEVRLPATRSPVSSGTAGRSVRSLIVALSFGWLEAVQ